MSHPEHLPIYKLCYELLALSSQAYKQMPRDFKPTLGRQIMADCTQMAVLVSRANACTQAARAAHITQLLELLSATQMLLRLCHDLRMLSHGIWAHAIQIMDGIGKQAGGYRCDLYDDLYKGWRRIDRAAHADGAKARVESLWLSPTTAANQGCLLEQTA